MNVNNEKNERDSEDLFGVMDSGLQSSFRDVKKNLNEQIYKKNNDLYLLGNWEAPKVSLKERLKRGWYNFISRLCKGSCCPCGETCDYH